MCVDSPVCACNYIHTLTHYAVAQCAHSLVTYVENHLQLKEWQEAGVDSNSLQVCKSLLT